MSSKVVGTEGAQPIVFVYKPKPLQQSVTGEALTFLENAESAGSDFKLNEFVASKSGLSDRAKASLDEKVELLTLERLKEVQEGAYREAYALGLQDGAKKAHEEKAKEIDEGLAEVSKVLKSILFERKNLLLKHEAYFIRLIYLIARKIVVRELTAAPDLIIEVLRDVIEKEMLEGEVVARVSDEDFKLLSDFGKSEDNEFLAKVKLEPDDAISRGGCVVESNFGVIDASIEKKLDVAWALIEERLPRGHAFKSEKPDS